ncbi:MAG: Mu transposase domain-containing protein [Thermodesulfovibrionales bacterium]
MPFGIVYGFVFILAYSRYLFVKFYPRQSLEFFLDGHISAYKEIMGVAQRNRYDNLKTVVIKRHPELSFNAQFLDFARHYGFSIYPCNPGRANEKGRVERVIRDIKDYLKVETFTDIDELNRRFSIWRKERNERVHRCTGKRPADAIMEERLKELTQIPYKPYRITRAQISKTGFVEFETNKYSVPSQYSGASSEILAYPEYIEVVINGRKITTHRRSFGRKQKIENPSHRERLLSKTPNFKYQRIYQLMKGMDKGIEEFLKEAGQEGEDALAIAYELFKLLRGISKETLISAVREANSIRVYRVKYIQSLLQPSGSSHDNPVHPQDRKLLEITYHGRDLGEYDELI